MTTLNTYKFEKGGVTVLISNKKSHWELSVSSNDRIIIIHNDLKIWNTLRGGKECAKKILSNY